MTVNGAELSRMTHGEAVAVFKRIKHGRAVVLVRRRTKSRVIAFDSHSRSAITAGHDRVIHHDTCCNIVELIAAI